MATSVIAFPQSLRWNFEPSPISFGEDYLARLRGGDEETVKHFNNHFRRLLRLKFWSQFSREQGEELANDVMAAVWERISQGAPDLTNRLPAYILGVCSTLVNKQAPRPPAGIHNGRRVTREQLRAFFSRRHAKHYGDGRA
jgi:hypothetical protein